MRSFAWFEDDFLTGSSTAHAFELEGLFQNDLRRDLVDDAAMLDLRNPGCAKTRVRLIGRHAFIDHRSVIDQVAAQIILEQALELERMGGRAPGEEIILEPNEGAHA